MEKTQPVIMETKNLIIIKVYLSIALICLLAFISIRWGLYLSPTVDSTTEFFKIREENTYSYDYTLIRVKTNTITKSGTFPWIITDSVIERDTIYQCDCPNKN